MAETSLRGDGVGGACEVKGKEGSDAQSAGRKKEAEQGQTKETAREEEQTSRRARRVCQSAVIRRRMVHSALDSRNGTRTPPEPRPSNNGGKGSVEEGKRRRDEEKPRQGLTPV